MLCDGLAHGPRPHPCEEGKGPGPTWLVGTCPATTSLPAQGWFGVAPRPGTPPSCPPAEGARGTCPAGTPFTHTCTAASSFE